MLLLTLMMTGLISSVASRAASFYPLSPSYELCIRAIRGNVARRHNWAAKYSSPGANRVSPDLAQGPQVYETGWAHPRGFALSRKASLFTMPTTTYPIRSEAEIPCVYFLSRLPAASSESKHTESLLPSGWDGR